MSKVPLVILDTPYRTRQLLEVCQDIYPKNHRGFLAQDITGEYETYVVGNFKKLLKEYLQKKNFVLIIEGKK